jgi:hypothetical protein
MKIKVSKLRKLIKEVISEVADYDGKYSLDDIDIGYIPPKPENNDAEWRKRMEAKHGPDFMRKYSILGPDEKLFGKVPPPEDPEVIAQRERYAEIDKEKTRYENVVTANVDIVLDSSIIRGKQGYLHDPKQARAPFNIDKLEGAREKIKQFYEKKWGINIPSTTTMTTTPSGEEVLDEGYSEMFVKILQELFLLNPTYTPEVAVTKVGVTLMEGGYLGLVDHIKEQRSPLLTTVKESKRRRRSK